MQGAAAQPVGASTAFLAASSAALLAPDSFLTRFGPLEPVGTAGASDALRVLGAGPEERERRRVEVTGAQCRLGS